VYTLSGYLAMLSEARVSAYAGAITSIVRPGDHVIELGSGFGYFSVVAARAGAARVDAIDINPVVHLGKRIAEANGCGDRIRFHHGDISSFEPDGRADVIVGDLRGPTPFADRALEVLIDARRRMLRPGGAMIAHRDVLYCAPSREPGAFRRRVHAPLNTAIDLSAVAAVAMTTPFQCAIDSNDLLAPGLSWGEIDYTAVESPHHRGAAEWVVERDVTMDGVAVWFESHLGAGHTLSTAPAMAETTYSNLYLPFATPVTVAGGATLALELGVRLVAGHYVWIWSARVSPAGGGQPFTITQNSIAERVVDPGAFGKGL
jgi:SAM-dependent methyltransferase